MRKLSASRFLPIFYFLGIDFCKLWKDNDHYLFFMAQPFFRLSFDWIFSCTARASVFYLQKFIKRLCNTNSERPIDSILPTFCQNIYLHLLNVRLPLYTLLSNLPSPLWSSTDIHHRSRQVIDKRRLSKSCGFSTKSQTCALPKQLNSPECKIFYFGIKMMFCTRLIFFSLVWGKLRDKKNFPEFCKKATQAYIHKHITDYGTHYTRQSWLKNFFVLLIVASNYINNTETIAVCFPWKLSLGTNTDISKKVYVRVTFLVHSCFNILVFTFCYSSVRNCKGAHFVALEKTTPRTFNHHKRIA